MGDLLDQTEQAVFQGDRDQSEPIYLQHRNTERLDRAVHPMLAIFDTLERGEPVESPEGLQPHLRDVGNHARRLSEEVVQLGNALDGLLNANVARVTYRQNVIIQQVSSWAAIAAVPTIITGVYGMNFRHMPELDWTYWLPARNPPHGRSCPRAPLELPPRGLAVTHGRQPAAEQPGDLAISPRGRGQLGRDVGELDACGPYVACWRSRWWPQALTLWWRRLSSHYRRSSWVVADLDFEVSAAGDVEPDERGVTVASPLHDCAA